MEDQCPLCDASGALFYEDRRHRFYSCPNCIGLFRDPQQLPDHQLEKDRYLLHQDATNDQGYLNFVAPLLEGVQNEMPKGSKALDYGCGHSPVISEVLHDLGYDFSIYDPFFHPDQEPLKRQYDFVTCCEVVEHFHQPYREFRRLYELLKPGGKLFCMTYIYEEQIDFSTWHYKNDPTHVFIYTRRTFIYLAEKIGFQNPEISGRLIIFSK